VDELKAVEIKAFVPARDFALSKQFYQDLGFTMPWSSEGMAYLHHGNCAFLLQKYYVKQHAESFMMHMLVTDADAWWRHVEATGIAKKYDIQAGPPEDRPWGIRDFTLIDPTGVLWRIGHSLDDSEEDLSSNAKD
jgi:Glyoxalase/Bleomycin resistance protein/Dioxygenase superfamily